MRKFYSISIFKICCLQRQYLKSNQLINKSKKRPQPIDWYCRISIWPKFVESPPRVREKLFPLSQCQTHDQDHPRVCGKNFCSSWCLSRRWGSPPRVREKPMFSAGNEVMYRITPACAGKTNVPTLSAILPWDHPRVCGKNILLMITTNLNEGSPPRVREKPNDKGLSAL